MSKLVSRILVPVDFSECSKNAIDYALFLAHQFDASVELFHVIWDPPPYVGFEAVMMQTPRDDPQRFADFSRSAAASQMDALLSDIPSADRARLSHRLAHGEASQAILELAAEENFDLLVMGTHGRDGLPHVLMGSVAEKVVRRSPCPVVTLRNHRATAVGIPAPVAL